ncbi:MAG: glycosyltransferase family 4 protein [Saprospiraceae bacterium]|nr:glycosyltransferase family 4 protein [Saprospiraceae bacterium]
MKILFVLESYYPNVGGLETLFTSLVNSLAHYGHEITIITNKPSSKLSTGDVPHNVNIHRYNFRNRYLFTLLAFFPALWYARKHDLIHTTSYNAAIPAFLAGTIYRKKVFITFHEYWGKLWFSLPFFSRILLWGHYIFEKGLVKIPFDKFIAVSQHTYDRLEQAGVPAAKIERIYNGISYDAWKPPKANIKNSNRHLFRFIYFGRLGISKGLDLLIEAAYLLNRRGALFALHLVLPIEPKGLFNRVLNLIAQKELSELITIDHHLPKSILIEKITNADAVVIPSYNEGFCYTAVESVALGMPVIYTNRGALPEVVSGKYIVVDKFNAESLANAMQMAISGNWDKSELKYFYLADTVNDYISLYQEFLDSEG